MAHNMENNPPKTPKKVRFEGIKDVEKTRSVKEKANKGDSGSGKEDLEKQYKATFLNNIQAELKTYKEQQLALQSSSTSANELVNKLQKERQSLLAKGKECKELDDYEAFLLCQEKLKIIDAFIAQAFENEKISYIKSHQGELSSFASEHRKLKLESLKEQRRKIIQLWNEQEKKPKLFGELQAQLDILNGFIKKHPDGESYLKNSPKFLQSKMFTTQLRWESDIPKPLTAAESFRAVADIFHQKFLELQAQSEKLSNDVDVLSSAVKPFFATVISAALDAKNIAELMKQNKMARDTTEDPIGKSIHDFYDAIQKLQENLSNLLSSGTEPEKKEMQEISNAFRDELDEITSDKTTYAIQNWTDKLNAIRTKLSKQYKKQNIEKASNIFSLFLDEIKAKLLKRYKKQNIEKVSNIFSSFLDENGAFCKAMNLWMYNNQQLGILKKDTTLIIQRGHKTLQEFAQLEQSGSDADKYIFAILYKNGYFKKMSRINEALADLNQPKQTNILNNLIKARLDIYSNANFSNEQKMFLEKYAEHLLAFSDLRRKDFIFHVHQYVIDLKPSLFFQKNGKKDLVFFNQVIDDIQALIRDTSHLTFHVEGIKILHTLYEAAGRDKKELQTYIQTLLINEVGKPCPPDREKQEEYDKSTQFIINEINDPEILQKVLFLASKNTYLVVVRGIFSSNISHKDTGDAKKAFVTQLLTKTNPSELGKNVIQIAFDNNNAEIVKFLIKKKIEIMGLDAALKPDVDYIFSALNEKLNSNKKLTEAQFDVARFMITELPISVIETRPSIKIFMEKRQYPLLNDIVDIRKGEAKEKDEIMKMNAAQLARERVLLTRKIDAIKKATSPLSLEQPKTQKIDTIKNAASPLSLEQPQKRLEIVEEQYRLLNSKQNAQQAENNAQKTAKAIAGDQKARNKIARDYQEEIKNYTEEELLKEKEKLNKIFENNKKFFISDKKVNAKLAVLDAALGDLKRYKAKLTTTLAKSELEGLPVSVADNKKEVATPDTTSFPAGYLLAAKKLLCNEYLFKASLRDKSAEQLQVVVKELEKNIEKQQKTQELSSVPDDRKLIIIQEVFTENENIFKASLKDKSVEQLKTMARELEQNIKKNQKAQEPSNVPDDRKLIIIQALDKIKAQKQYQAKAEKMTALDIMEEEATIRKSQETPAVDDLSKKEKLDILQQIFSTKATQIRPRRE